MLVREMGQSEEWSNDRLQDLQFMQPHLYEKFLKRCHLAIAGLQKILFLLNHTLLVSSLGLKYKLINQSLFQ